MISRETILEVRGLTKRFPLTKGFLSGWMIRDGRISRERKFVNAVNNVSFAIEKGEVFSLVGESGCGKTTTARSIVRLYEPDDGMILFGGENVTKIREKDFRPYRRKMQMIFQNPYSSLNPRHSVLQIVTQPILLHGLASSRSEAEEKAIFYLEKVGVLPEQAERYPHQFSGGQRQRISIARALAVSPEFIVADEPVSALDVSIQAQILNLLLDLRKEFNLSYLFIAHDLSVVRHVSDRVGIMYLGCLMEYGPCDSIFNYPTHPYTQTLLRAVPVLGERKMDSVVLTEEVPNAPTEDFKGCVFAHRCKRKDPGCLLESPVLKEVSRGHFVACRHFEK